ncbi:cupin domain-containing protein [Streptomyces sp. NPDC057257]|uniref:cupin domain-containing protein n=1 Tax=Streptomyces sp. NPDC057257 TaxID=3346071 RepID=UPI003645DE9F
MAHAGDTLHLGNDTLTFHRTAADTNGEYLEVEVDFAPAAFRPPIHYHPGQHERLDILDGALAVRMADTEQLYSAGETVFTPPRCPHTLWNPGPAHARVMWRTTPALRTERLFETLWGLAADHRIGPDGPLLQIALLTFAFRNEYRIVSPRPPAVDLCLSALLAPLALARGYRPYHRSPR